MTNACWPTGWSASYEKNEVKKHISFPLYQKKKVKYPVFSFSSLFSCEIQTALHPSVLATHKTTFTMQSGSSRLSSNLMLSLAVTLITHTRDATRQWPWHQLGCQSGDNTTTMCKTTRHGRHVGSGRPTWVKPAGSARRAGVDVKKFTQRQESKYGNQCEANSHGTKMTW